MRAYLKGLSEKIWVIVEKGFGKLDGDFEKWSREDAAKSNWNNRGLNCIFNYLSSRVSTDYSM
jgi:hypothetical protein